MSATPTANTPLGNPTYASVLMIIHSSLFWCRPPRHDLRGAWVCVYIVFVEPQPGTDIVFLKEVWIFNK